MEDNIKKDICVYKKKEIAIFSDCDICLKIINEFEMEEYRRLRNDKDNQKFFFHSAYISYEQQRKWFLDYLKNTNELMFAIYDINTNEFIGAISLYNIDAKIKSAEIGRLIIDRKKAGGKGYASKAINALINWAQEKLGISYYYAEIYYNNIASRRTFEKSQFVYKENLQVNGNRCVCVERKMIH